MRIVNLATLVAMVCLCGCVETKKLEYPIPQVVASSDEIGFVRITGAENANGAKERYAGKKVCLTATRVAKGSEGYDDRAVRDKEIFAAIKNGLDFFEYHDPLPDVVSIQMHDAGVKTIRHIEDPLNVQPSADLGVKYLVSPDPEKTKAALLELKRRMEGPVDASQFRVRDPFILADAATRTYYLYETTPWNTGRGVNVRTSKDLKIWSAPKRVMNMPKQVKCRSVWAPEVHEYKGKYYLFATPTLEPDPKFPIKSMSDDPDFAPPECYALTRRGTWIWKADSPLGPFRAHSDMSATPHDYVALDGTLLVDPDGSPWMIYCHEWTQMKIGRMDAGRLKDDLSGLAEKPVELFRADTPFGSGHVTDGPYCYRSPKSGKLFMIWSTFCGRSYSVISCESESSKALGPWGNFKTVFADNGGHGMILKTFDGELKLVMHKPEVRGVERLTLFNLKDDGNSLKVVE